jgi:CheY-like chemotaxis protein
MHDCIRMPQKTGPNCQADPLRVMATDRQQSATAALPNLSDELEQWPSPCRVLIVEDNTDGRETLQTLLELLGYRVEVAEDGLGGLEKAFAWRPEVVLLDIGLPGLDGYQVAQQLRSAFGDQILLIAYTGYGRPEDRCRAFQAGFNAHLVKPVDVAELCRQLGKSPSRVRP